MRRSTKANILALVLSSALTKSSVTALHRVIARIVGAKLLIGYLTREES